jgi:hypothetical protein
VAELGVDEGGVGVLLLWVELEDVLSRGGGADK